MQMSTNKQQYNYDAGTSLQCYQFTLVRVDFLWYEFAMVRVDYKTIHHFKESNYKIIQLLSTEQNHGYNVKHQT